MKTPASADTLRQQHEAGRHRNACPPDCPVTDIPVARVWATDEQAAMELAHTILDAFKHTRRSKLTIHRNSRFVDLAKRATGETL